MTGDGAKFGRKKEDAIVALLGHRTIEEPRNQSMSQRKRFSVG
jgi:hypothetical protein